MPEAMAEGRPSQVFELEKKEGAPPAAEPAAEPAMASGEPEEEAPLNPLKAERLQRGASNGASKEAEELFRAAVDEVFNMADTSHDGNLDAGELSRGP